jgi:voltage-gated potassium channel
VDDERRVRWEASTEWPLTGLAVVFLAVYAVPILRPDLPAAAVSLCVVTGWLVWAVFVADYLARWALSRNRQKFVAGTAVDLVVIALPLLRPLRVLRLLTLLDILNRRASSSLRGRVAAYVGSATSLIIFCSALTVLDAERSNPDANITTFADALWWATTTVTTVGYGDRFPTTSGGRLVAVLLMVGGIALLGIVTAGLASWLIDRIRAVEAESQAVTRHDIAELTAQVEALRSEVSRLAPGTHALAASPGLPVDPISALRDGNR